MSFRALPWGDEPLHAHSQSRLAPERRSGTLRVGARELPLLPRSSGPGARGFSSLPSTRSSGAWASRAASSPSSASASLSPRSRRGAPRRPRDARPPRLDRRLLPLHGGPTGFLGPLLPPALPPLRLVRRTRARAARRTAAAGAVAPRPRRPRRGRPLRPRLGVGLHRHLAAAEHADRGVPLSLRDPSGGDERRLRRGRGPATDPASRRSLARRDGEGGRPRRSCRDGWLTSPRRVPARLRSRRLGAADRDPEGRKHSPSRRRDLAGPHHAPPSAGRRSLRSPRPPRAFAGGRLAGRSLRARRGRHDHLLRPPRRDVGRGPAVRPRRPRRKPLRRPPPPRPRPRQSRQEDGRPRGARRGRRRRPLEPPVPLGRSPPPVEPPVRDGLVPRPLRRKARLRRCAVESVPGAAAARPSLRLGRGGRDGVEASAGPAGRGRSAASRRRRPSSSTTTLPSGSSRAWPTEARPSWKRSSPPRSFSTSSRRRRSRPAPLPAA